MLKKHFVKIFLGILFSAILVYLTLRQIDLKESWEFIKKVNYSFLIPGALLYAFTYVLRAIRYRFIILPLKKTRLLESFPYTVIGFFANNIIPLRLGELIRAKITGQKLYISRSSILGTIITERLFDVMMFVLSFFMIIFFIPLPEFIKKSYYLLTLLFVICLGLLYVALIHGNKVLKLVSKIPIHGSIKIFVSDFLNKFTNGFEVLKKPSVLMKTFLISVAVWTTEALVLVVIAAACGVGLPLWKAAFTIVVIGIGVVVPTVPGYFGAFEFMGVTALSIMSVDKNAAFTCIALYHLLQLIVIFALGSVSVIKIKLSFYDLFKITKD